MWRGCGWRAHDFERRPFHGIGKHPIRTQSHCDRLQRAQGRAFMAPHGDKPNPP